MKKAMAWLLAVVAWVLLLWVCLQRFGLVPNGLSWLTWPNKQTTTSAAQPEATPLALFRHADGHWVLSGAVPDENAKQALLKQVQVRLGDGPLTQELAVVDAAPVPPSEFPPDLSALSLARVSWKNGQWAIAGQARSDEELARFRQALPPGIQAHLDDQLGVDPDWAKRWLDKINAAVANTDFSFVSGRSDLTPSGQAQLDQVASLLAQAREIKVEITGHTDDSGAAAANLGLSQARADYVRKYLSEHGVAAERLTAKGFGDTQPREPNTSAQGRAKNRRIEFRFN